MEGGGHRGLFLLPGSLSPLLGLVHCIWENILARQHKQRSAIRTFWAGGSRPGASNREPSKCGRTQGPDGTECWSASPLPSFLCGQVWRRSCREHEEAGWGWG